MDDPYFNFPSYNFGAPDRAHLRADLGANRRRRGGGVASFDARNVEIKIFI